MAGGGAYRGQGHGRLPNVHWRKVEVEELRGRGERGFVGLPPPEDLDLTTPAAFRFVRQDSPLWSAAHRGLLTSRHLTGALGFCEPSAARLLGMPHACIGHGALLQVYHHLREPPLLPMHATAAAAERSAAHNRAAIAAFNGAEGRATDGDAAHAPLPGALPDAPQPSAVQTAVALRLLGEADACAAGHAAGAASPRTKAKKKKKKKKKGGGGGGATAPASTSPAACAHNGPAAADEQFKRARAAALGGAGLNTVRCAWGSAQEAAALAVLLRLVPGAEVSEVGLCIPDPAALAARYGYGPGTLPPLGASPDACVRLPCTRRRGGGATPAGAGGPRCACSAAGAVAGAAAGTAQQGVGARGGVAGGASGGGGGGVQDEIHSLLRELKLGSVPSPGDGACDSSASDGRAADHSAAQQGAGSASDDGSGSNHGTQPCLCAACGATAGGGPATAAAGSARARACCGCGPRLEVLEVKSAVPFQLQSSFRGGRARREYVVHDPGPAARLRPAWVAQLQLEMLAAGAESGVLLSRSATKGVALFRMRRDDAYISDMLSLLSHLYTRHVLPGRPPLPGCYGSLPQYRRLQQRTLHLIKATRQLALWPDAHEHAPRSDMRLLLD